MDRYLLFGFNYFYPSGGMNDYLGAYDSVEKAKKATESGVYEGFNVYQIVDRETMNTVAEKSDNWDEEDWKGKNG